MKKLLSLVLTAVFLLTLAACGIPAAPSAPIITKAAAETPTQAQAAPGTIPWDTLGKTIGEVRASLGEVVSDGPNVCLDVAMCGFREKDEKLIYFVFGTQEILWDGVPDYANQLVVAGFCVTPAMLLPEFQDGMTAADFLKAIGVALDENAYWAVDDFGEEYSLSFAAGSEKLSMSFASDTVYGKGKRALQADDYILISSTAYMEKNEGDLGTKIPWDIISAASDAAWANRGQ